MIIKNDTDGRRQVLNALLNGENVCIPTDTVYGLVALALDRGAVSKIFSLKGRDEKKPLAMLVNSEDMAKRYIKSSDITERLMKEFWPGALTIVTEKTDLAFKDPIIAAATGEGDLIGVRFPKSDLIKEIIARIDAPIFATSVNFSGEEPLNDPLEIEEKFVSLLDENIIVLARDSEDFESISSTVVEIRDKNIKVLRRGVIADQVIAFSSNK